MLTKNQKDMKKKAETRQSVFSKIKLVFTRKGKTPKKAGPDAKKTFSSSVASDPYQSERPHDIAQLKPDFISHEIGQIKALLHQSKYVSAYLDSLSEKGSAEPIENIIMNDESFSKYACYHNKPVARYYAADLVGLGFLELLLSDHKFKNERITDIGYNSNHFLTVETNMRKFVYGNRKGQPRINNDVIMDIINKMTEQTGDEGRAFTKTFPLYNGSNKFYHLRISATHPSVSPYGPTLSIRVAGPYLALTEKNFNEFAPMNKKLNVLWLLKVFIKCHLNIMISAKTGAGKTELQKFLIKYIPDVEERIILMEDTQEMYLPDLFPKKDIFSWLSGHHKGANTITDLIEQSLRNAPTWLIVAETRGAEAYEMFQGVKTDHSIITTLHSSSNAAVPSRFAGMIQEGYGNMKTEFLERDFLDFMNIGIHLTIKRFHGRRVRYLDEIAEYLPVSEKYPKGINVLFKQNINAAGVRTYYTGAPSKELQNKIYEASDHYITKKRWPQYSAEKPVKEVALPELYDAYQQELKKRKDHYNG